ncbi:restriction endonuclease subunit S [Nocardiopsis dassonvillei]|uniref:restriction endonuclease subunit S n=1 Tax=Nocardiopsis dassonvillei TaxID=2014 RepID=UPI00366F4545
MSEELPEGWVTSRLADLGQWYGGATPSKAKSEFWEDGTIPWVSPKDMGQEVLLKVQDAITQKALESSPVRLVPDKSVVFVVRSGVLERRFPVALTSGDVTLNQDMKAICPNEAVDARWLAWGLRWMEQLVLQDCRKAGTTVASVQTARLMDIPFPVPPLSEQRRVVGALEAKLSRLENARALLEKSLARSLRLEARLVDADLEPFFLGEVRPLGELLREPLRNGHSARAVSQGGVRTLTLTAVTKGVFSDSHTKMTSASIEKSKGLWLESGDIFIQRSNTPDLVGTSAIYQGPNEWAIFPDLLIRVRVSGSLDPRFVLKILQSTRVRSHFKRSAKGLAGSMPKIDQRAIEQVLVPVPSLAVQHEVVDRINERAQSMSRVSEELQGVRKRADHLRRALLDAAFTGKLVPQDPADEPAVVLLERIRGERASAPNPKRARRSTAKSPKRLASTADVRTPADPQPVHAGEQTALEF